MSEESTPAALPPGTLVDGRFRVEAHLGQGGMGDVYRAEHVLMKRPVALKILRPEWAAQPEMATRFQREAQLVSQLDHPFIVRVFDFGRTPEGMFFLSMELVEGRSLEANLQEGGPWTPDHAVRLLRHICAALSVAHARGIVHRDLKPDNILLSPVAPPGIAPASSSELFPKILDFGIARLADSESPKEGTQITRMGMTLGTPEYISPEQALAQPLDARTDVYSLSVMAFRMIAGRLPFESDDPRTLLSQHINAEPPRLTAVRPDLAALPLLVEAVHRGMSKDREKRYESAEVMSAALASSFGEVGATAISASFAPARGVSPLAGGRARATSGGKPDLRTAMVVGAAIAGTAAFAAGSWAVWRAATRPVTEPGLPAATTNRPPPAPAPEPSSPPTEAEEEEAKPQSQPQPGGPYPPPSGTAAAAGDHQGPTSGHRSRTPLDDFQSLVDDLIPPKNRTGKKNSHHKSTGASEAPR